MLVGTFLMAAVLILSWLMTLYIGVLSIELAMDAYRMRSDDKGRCIESTFASLVLMILTGLMVYAAYQATLTHYPLLFG